MPRYRDIPEYLGDSFLEDLIKECDKTPYKRNTDYFRKRDKALVATLFLTGGYVKNVLMLRKRNFDFEDEEAKRMNAFFVKKMRVGRYREKKGKPRWMTRTFKIFKDDPLVQYLLDWLDLLPEADDYLFRSGRGRVWQIIQDLGKRSMRANFFISPMDLRIQRIYYLAEQRGYTPVQIQQYLGMRVPPSIFARPPVTRKPKQKERLVERLHFPNDILKKLPREVRRTIKGVVFIYQHNYPRFCFWGMRTALIDAIRIRFRRDGKGNELYDENGNAYKLSKWIDLAQKERYINSYSAKFLKSQVKVFGDIASHDYMADVHKEEIPLIFTRLRMILARMYYEEKSR